MITETLNKKLLCATAIYSSVEVLLDETATPEQKQAVSNALSTLFKYIMPFLRGDKSGDSVLKCVEDITAIYSTVENSTIKPLIEKFSEFVETDADTLRFWVIPALCKAMANENRSYDIPDEAPMYECLQAIGDVICRGESLGTISKQLEFINSILNIPAIEFIGDKPCKELCSAITELGGNFAYSKAFTEDFAYSVFHKIRLSDLMLHYTEKDTEKSKAELQALTEQYGTENGDIFIDDPFFIKKRDREVFVKGLQKYTLETLVLTKKFLEENNLRFYLTEGTLLGAIRHNGFIPWDDDVDIAMPREDYNRLVELAKQGKIPPELNFDSLENNPNHWVLGAKMQLVRKTPYIQHKVTKLSKCNGPYVDIFPLDYWNRPAGLKFSIAAMWVKICRRLLFIKTGYSIRARKRSYLIVARLMTLFLKNTWIEKLAIKNMTKFFNGNRKYSVNLCSYYPYYKEVFPTSFFGEPKYIKFEGELMPVPCEYDCMLKTVYARSYDTIPPVKVTNMRKHAFELVDSDEI